MGEGVTAEEESKMDDDGDGCVSPKVFTTGEEDTGEEDDEWVGDCEGGEEGFAVEDEGESDEDEEEDGGRVVEEIEGCVEVGVVAEGVVVDDGVVEDDDAVLVDNVTCDEEDEG